MTARIRPVQVTITVTAVLDDGETLTPVEIVPITLTPAALKQFDLGEQITQLQAQLDADSPAT